MNLLQQHLATYFPLESRRTWYARWSGGRLDLHVKSNFSSSPEGFREGVMDVGFLLQSLDRSLQIENHLLEIRSFPSLDQAQWIASVRLHRASGSRKGFTQETPKTTDPIEVIAGLALDWNFSFLYLDRRETPLHKEDTDPTSPRYLFRGILETSGNNPFVWLQTGRWLREADDNLRNATPPLRIDWETHLPDAIREQIPLLDGREPWEDLIPDERVANGKRWVPQLLLTVRSAEE